MSWFVPGTEKSLAELDEKAYQGIATECKIENKVLREIIIKIPINLAPPR